MKTKDRLGEISVITAAILWGCIGFFTRNLTDAGFSPIVTVGFRSFLTTVFMLVIILIKNPKLLKINIKDLPIFLCTGILSFTFFNICYMSSIKENSLSVACILLYTSPVFVTVLSFFVFKERITLRKIICLIVCLTGCALVCMSGSLKCTKAGLIFGILSGFGYALYSIFGKAAAKKYDSFTTVFYTFLISFAVSLPFCIKKEVIMLAVYPKNAALLLGISVINTLVPYILYTYGLSKIEAGKAATISIIEPVAAAVTGFVLFSEKIGVFGIIGILTVASGLYLSGRRTEDL